MTDSLNSDDAVDGVTEGGDKPQMSVIGQLGYLVNLDVPCGDELLFVSNE
jgi:hypothetical protein